jgi:ABC-2 type transport system ATP-binding protein
VSALLELRNVHKLFGPRTAVDGVSFSLMPGEVHGLLGPNGAGKTTLLRLAVDLLRPDGGEVVRSAPLERFGYLPEERGLPARPRLLELLTYLAELKGLRRAEAAAQAKRLLARVQLEARARDRVGTLSKGNQQKVQIAAVLIGDPEVLLVDEPFSGLDPVNRQLAVELLREETARGRAVLISTHELRQVEELCDRLILIHRGCTLLSGSVQAIRAQFSDGSLRVAGEGDFASLPCVARVENGRLFLRPGATSDDVLRDALARGVHLKSFGPALPGLDEIFVRVVSEHDLDAPPAEVLA